MKTASQTDSQPKNMPLTLFMKFVIQWYPICGVYLQPFGRDWNINRQTDRLTDRLTGKNFEGLSADTFAQCTWFMSLIPMKHIQTKLLATFCTLFSSMSKVLWRIPLTSAVFAPPQNKAHAFCNTLSLSLFRLSFLFSSHGFVTVRGDHYCNMPWGGREFTRERGGNQPFWDGE